MGRDQLLESWSCIMNALKDFYQCGWGLVRVGFIWSRVLFVFDQVPSSSDDNEWVSLTPQVSCLWFFPFLKPLQWLLLALAQPCFALQACRSSFNLPFIENWLWRCSLSVICVILRLNTHGSMSRENFLAIFFCLDYPNKHHVSSIHTNKHTNDKTIYIVMLPYLDFMEFQYFLDPCVVFTYHRFFHVELWFILKDWFYYYYF